MNRISRRDLARSVTERLLTGEDMSVVIRQTAAYLLQNRRASQMDALLDDIALLLQAKTGHATADVTVARPLTAENRKALEAFVKEWLGAGSVELSIHEDKEIIGGMIIRTAEYEYDGSTRNKLNQLARGKV